eukprot:7842462-Alexandrium_andersonii.AAC.1
MSATLCLRSISAGSLLVLRSTLPRCPSLRMLSAAWSTVSLRSRPLHSTGRARIAREVPVLHHQDREAILGRVLGEEAVVHGNLWDSMLSSH